MMHSGKRRTTLRPVPTPEVLAPLSPHWAFVVQLRRDTSFAATRLQGRIEHIRSGQATTFSSLEEVRVFMERVLTEEAGGST